MPFSNMMQYSTFSDRPLPLRKTLSSPSFFQNIHIWSVHLMIPYQQIFMTIIQH